MKFALRWPSVPDKTRCRLTAKVCVSLDKHFIKLNEEMGLTPVKCEDRVKPCQAGNPSDLFHPSTLEESIRGRQGRNCTGQAGQALRLTGMGIIFPLATCQEKRSHRLRRGGGDGVC